MHSGNCRSQLRAVHNLELGLDERKLTKLNQEIVLQSYSYENVCDAAGQRILGMVQCVWNVCQDGWCAQLCQNKSGVPELRQNC
jgi:hypothetical protein